MKLSELIEQHPEMDVDLGDFEETEIFADGVYLFRVVDMRGDAGDARLVMTHPVHTDDIVETGLITQAHQSLAMRWPVHICEGDH